MKDSAPTIVASAAIVFTFTMNPSTTPCLRHRLRTIRLITTASYSKFIMAQHSNMSDAIPDGVEFAISFSRPLHHRIAGKAVKEGCGRHCPRMASNMCAVTGVASIVPVEPSRAAERRYVQTGSPSGPFV